jgi:hypothetical protein
VEQNTVLRWQHISIAVLLSVLGCNADSSQRAPTKSRAQQISSDLKRGPSFEVEANADTVSLRNPDASSRTLAWSDVRRILVVTTDEGPQLTDVFFILEGAGAALVIPQDAKGNETLVDWLVRVKGFDHMAFVKAMGSSDNAELECWSGTKVVFGLNDAKRE